MKKIVFFSLLLLHVSSFAQIPSGVGGFTLNADVEQFRDQLKAETTLPIRFMEGVSEVEIQPRPGFKSGYIAYGNCAAPGKIIRIKLKYKESSKQFHQQLLDAYKDKFGKPKWLGDPFHVVSTWKWTFKDGDNEVEIYLQHNLSNKDEKVGNSVKMTMLNLLSDEHACFTAQNPDFRKADAVKSSGDKPGLEDLIPN